MQPVAKGFPTSHPPTGEAVNQTWAQPGSVQVLPGEPHCAAHHCQYGTSLASTALRGEASFVAGPASAVTPPSNHGQGQHPWSVQ